VAGRRVVAARRRRLSVELRKEGLMANITRRGEPQQQLREWDPLRRMRDLFDWDPFAEMMPYQASAMVEFQPRFEVKETKDSYVFRADLPGVEEKDLDIALTGNRLTISGSRRCEERKEDERFYAYECAYGSFTRSFTLPEGIDVENVNADLKEGVLHLVVPKRPETQPRKIALKGMASDKGKAKA
jgi:HSP20 family protein